MLLKYKKFRVHFMGIGGSGMSAVAQLAHHAGFKVSGCDLSESTPYLDKLKKSGIPVFVGHHKSHLEDTDIFAITAAAFFQSKDEEEFIQGKKSGKMMQWQEFVGKYLHHGKKVISIAGTNGKSTTTALAGLILEEAGLDPSVMIGATVNKWGTNYRAGRGKYFVTESDEFFNNFHAYRPDIIILNNIEFDHPDFFNSFDEIINSFARFVGNLKGEKILIFNQDDQGIKILFKKLGKKYLKTIRLFGYTLKGKITKRDSSGSFFAVDGNQYHFCQPGDFNVSNALGVINLCSMLNISSAIINKVLENFQIGRRLEKLGEADNGIVVYDDYGHHPSAIKVTLKALKQKYPRQKIWAIVEPHSFSRTKATLSLYKNAFSPAEKVIIAPIFQARDNHDFGISGNSIVKIASHNDISYMDSFDKIVEFISKNVNPKTVIIIFGAGKSYQLAKDILKGLT